MSKQKILGTGLSGLVGSKFVELYGDHYDITNLDLSTGVDITDLASIQNMFEKNEAEFVVHFAAFTDVNKAHEERGNKDGITYKVNVIGTKNIADACKQFSKHLIHISTAYVFDGEKEGYYSETDPMKPIEWYGQTKAWAEEEVEKSGVNHTIFRIDQPFREDDFPKLDILHRIKKGLVENSLPPMFVDHTFTPTKIETFADILHKTIEKRFEGLYHASTEPKTSDYEFAVWVKKKFQLDGEVKEGFLDDYLKTAMRPYHRNTAMNTDKLKAVLGV